MSDDIPKKAPAPRPWLAYDYPLDGFMAQLVLPRNLTPMECAKLAAFIKTLAMEEKAIST